MPPNVLEDAQWMRRGLEPAVDPNHHLFDTIDHAVALEAGATLVTADDRYFDKASRHGGGRRLADVSVTAVERPRPMTVLVPDLPKTEIAIVEMTNALRAQNKLGQVTANPKLAAAARAYAQFLAKSDLFSHTADGRQPADRIKSAGYAYCTVSENLALNLDSRGFETRQLAHEAVEGWKGSPPHRKNMLEPAVTEIGVAVAKSSREEKYLSVQLFGRPDSLKYEFRIDNLSQATVAYTFAAKAHELKASTAVRHTACLPGAIEVTGAKGADGKAVAITGRYEARNGDHYSIRAAANGAGVTIAVKRAEAPAPSK